MKSNLQKLISTLASLAIVSGALTCIPTTASGAVNKPSNIKTVALKSGFKVKFKKVKSASGYIVQYSTNKKFTNSKTVTIKKTATSKIISKLAKKQKYYVRLKSYISTNGNKKYSSWSKVKSVTTLSKHNKTSLKLRLQSVLKKNYPSDKGTLRHFLYDDYDGNGTKEAFGITAADFDYDGDMYDKVNIYYINSKGTVNRICTNLYGYLNSKKITAKKSKFIQWIVNAHGCGSKAYIFGVKNNYSYEPSISRKYDFVEKNNSVYIAYKEDHSSGALDYKEVKYKFNNGTKEFYQI